MADVASSGHVGVAVVIDEAAFAESALKLVVRSLDSEKQSKVSELVDQEVETFAIAAACRDSA